MVSVMENNNFNINDDDFIIGKGFNLEEPEQNDKKKRGKRAKKGGSAVKNIIWILCIVVVSVALAATAIVALSDFVGIGFGRGEVVQMDIPYGSPTVTVAEKLQDTGAVKMPLLFRVYSKFKGYESQYKYGLYTFNTDIGYAALADMLMNDGAKAESVKVTIPEGTGINDYTKNVNGEDVVVKGIATILEENGVCSKADFIYALGEVEFNTELLGNCNEGKTYYSLEGYLFPDTYDFYAYDSAECAKMVVEKMIAQTESKITSDMYKRAKDMGYTMNEILTMASIIQMEAGQSNSEMANVAAVFYNRLDSADFGTLGSSPTCYYGDSFKNDDGRYNTYNVNGLPPGPLCSPGIDAINAALYPTENSDYFYFVTDSNGNFYFHKTMAEQNATIAKLQQGDNWIYEYFD